MPNQIVAVVPAVADIPEVRALLRCARQRHIRFGLRGGIIRNLLVTFHEWEHTEASLFRFVDAFSDIDVIVSSPDDWPALWESIVTTVPFAAFFRWEATPLSQLLAAQASFERILIDRFILWVDGTQDPELAFGFVGGDPQKAWRQFLSHEHPPIFPLEWIERANRASILLVLLKIIRYRVAYGEGQAVLDDQTYVKYFAEIEHVLVRTLRDRPSDLVDQRFVIRFELGILDILFNARRWLDALGIIRELPSLVPRSLLSRSPLTRAVTEQRDIEHASAIGASVYRSGLRGGLKRRLHFNHSAPSLSPAMGSSSSPPSITPWTPIQVGDPDSQRDCCRYRDFRFGSAVLAWRPTPEVTPYSRDPTRLATVARVPLRPQYGELATDADSAIIPLPGIVEPAQSVVVRFDHGYVRAVAGRDLTFELGVVEAPKL